MIGNISIGANEISPLTNLLELVTDPAGYKQKLQTLADRTAEANRVIEQANAAVAEAETACAEADRRKAAADASVAAIQNQTDHAQQLAQEAKANQLKAEQAAKEAADKHALLEELLTSLRKLDLNI